MIREAEGSGLKKFEVPGTGWYPSRWISAKRSEAKEEAHNSGRRDIRFWEERHQDAWLPESRCERGICIGGREARVGEYVRQARKAGRMGRTESFFPKMTIFWAREYSSEELSEFPCM